MISFLIYIILITILEAMGCEVVSVYADEVIGKIGIPDPVARDLFVRDYQQSYYSKDCKKMASDIKHIFGFNLSLVSSYFCTTIVSN